MAACANAKLDVARLLIDWGADPDHTDSSGASAFFVACAEGHCDVIRWLASLGEHVDMRRADHNGTKPFFAAVDGTKATAFSTTCCATVVDKGCLGSTGGHTTAMLLLAELGLDEEGALANPFRHCWRAHRHKGNKREQASIIQSSLLNEGMDGMME